MIDQSDCKQALFRSVLYFAKHLISLSLIRKQINTRRSALVERLSEQGIRSHTLRKRTPLHSKVAKPRQIRSLLPCLWYDFDHFA